MLLADEDVEVDREAILNDGIKYARMLLKIDKSFHAQYTIFFFKGLAWDQQEECFNAVRMGFTARVSAPARPRKEPSINVNAVNLLSNLFSKGISPDFIRGKKSYSRIARQAEEDTGVDHDILIDLFCIGWCFRNA